MSRVNRDGWSVCSSSGQRESRIITLLSNCTSSKHIVDMFAMTRFWLNSFVPSFVPSILQLHYKGCPCYKVVLFMLQPCPCYNHVHVTTMSQGTLYVTRLYCLCSMLQGCTVHVTTMLQGCTVHVTTMLQGCTVRVTRLYHSCTRFSTSMLVGNHCDVTFV